MAWSTAVTVPTGWVKKVSSDWRGSTGKMTKVMVRNNSTARISCICTRERKRLIASFGNSTPSIRMASAIASNVAPCMMTTPRKKVSTAASSVVMPGPWSRLAQYDDNNIERNPANPARISQDAWYWIAA